MKRCAGIPGYGNVTLTGKPLGTQAFNQAPEVQCSASPSGSFTPIVWLVLETPGLVRKGIPQDKANMKANSQVQLMQPY